MEDRRKVLSWALYDWANSAFAITVMSAFFPLFLKQYWSDGADATITTFRLGLANSIGGIVIALLSPILGAIADQAGTRKRYLIFFAAMAIVMTGALQFAARAFEDLGAKVEERDPGFEDPQEIFTRHWFPGAAAFVRGVPGGKRRLMDKGLLEAAKKGERVTTAQYFDAMQKRYALGALMSRFHEKYELLLTPTLPLAAFDAGRDAPKGMRRWTNWTPFSFPFNLTQQPAASIPCGLTKAGLPVGLHIVGPKYAEALVLRAARAFEKARPIAMPDLSRLVK